MYTFFFLEGCTVLDAVLQVHLDAVSSLPLMEWKADLDGGRREGGGGMHQHEKRCIFILSDIILVYKFLCHLGVVCMWPARQTHLQPVLILKVSSSLYSILFYFLIVFQGEKKKNIIIILIYFLYTPTYIIYLLWDCWQNGPN